MREKRGTYSGDHRVNGGKVCPALAAPVDASTREVTTVAHAHVVKCVWGKVRRTCVIGGLVWRSRRELGNHTRGANLTRFAMDECGETCGVDSKGDGRRYIHEWPGADELASGKRDEPGGAGAVWERVSGVLGMERRRTERKQGYIGGQTCEGR